MLLSTKNISFNHARNTFMAEISELGKEFRFENLAGSTKRGLTLDSHKTNNKIDFYITEEARDDEGDILYWRLVPTDGKHHDLAFVLFND